uniref:Uncharacterized protein n=1 Tax=Brassica oleracea var. oleracea TaxID=109376 RepID=A0A0D3CFQ2_BRAOL
MIDLQKRYSLRFDVQEFCDNFEKEMLKALKYVSQVHKKSTSTRAPVAEPSLFISEKPKELTILQREHPSSLVFSPQVFEEEPLDLPHQGPRLDTRISFNEDLDPIFDEEDEPGPVFDEEATNITSIAMESHLFFDPGTTPPAPLSFELQEHCEQSDLFNSQPDMFVKISSLDAICFGLEKSDLLSSETDKIWHFLRSILDNCVVLSLDDIVVYNTFFEKHLGSLIVDSQSELKLVCSDVEQDMHILKMNTIVGYLDKILERQVQPLRNESIDRAQQPEIWRNFVIQTGYLGDASDRGSVQNGYLNIQKVFCHESNFPGNPTHQGFTEAWNHFKIFMEEGVMNFPNRWFSSPSIREYQTSKGDSDPRKKWPEPKPILHEPKDIKGQFHKEASRGGRHNTYVLGTWNWKYSRKTSEMDLRTNPFEERRNDSPQSMDQYMEPYQNGDQTVQDSSAEVHLPSRTAQDDRAVYRLHPLTSGMKLQPSPRPEDQSDRTSTRPSQPSRQAKVNSRDRLDLDHARLDMDHARLDLDHFSKARIIQLSEDLGRISTLLDQATDCPDRPAFVQLLTAVTST